MNTYNQRVRISTMKGRQSLPRLLKHIARQLYWSSKFAKDEAQKRHDFLVINGKSELQLAELADLKLSLKYNALKDKIKVKNKELNVFEVRGKNVTSGEFEKYTNDYLKNQVKRLERTLVLQNERYKIKGNYGRIKTISAVIANKSLVTEYLLSLPIEYWDERKIIKFDEIKTPFVNMNGQLINKWFIDKVLDPEKLKLWETTTVNFIKSELIRITDTDKNYISHIVHNDERQPHIHLYMHNIFGEEGKASINVNGFLIGFEVSGSWRDRQNNFTTALAEELNLKFDPHITYGPLSQQIQSGVLNLDSFRKETKSRELKATIFDKNRGISEVKIKESNKELKERIDALYKAITLDKPLSIASARLKLKPFLSVAQINKIENNIRMDIKKLDYI